MTDPEYVALLDSLNGDVEVDHSRADSILLDALREFGHPDIADAYDRARQRVGFWYA